MDPSSALDHIDASGAPFPDARAPDPPAADVHAPGPPSRRVRDRPAKPRLASDPLRDSPAPNGFEPAGRDVRCFVLVARHLGFSRAATEMGMSQPAVSQAIGRLERSFGVRLFERTSREVRLTSEGRALLPYADTLLEASAALSAEAARLAASAGRSIRLAYPSLLGAFVAQVARRLARRRPAIEVGLRHSGRQAALAELARGEVSVAILSTPVPHGLATAARFHVPVGHLAVPTGDPLADRSRIKPEQLARYRVLMPRNRPAGGMWARLATHLRGPHQHRVVADDIDDFAAALDLVAAGAGVLPSPHLLTTAIRRHDVRFVPLDVGDLRITYALAWSPDRVSPELMALVRAVQEALWTR
jgi:DNA-binding transcriptional LysR family regulator